LRISLRMRSAIDLRISRTRSLGIPISRAIVPVPSPCMMRSKTGTHPFRSRLRISPADSRSQSLASWLPGFLEEAALWPFRCLPHRVASDDEPSNDPPGCSGRRRSSRARASGCPPPSPLLACTRGRLLAPGLRLHRTAGLSSGLVESTLVEDGPVVSHSLFRDACGCHLCHVEEGRIEAV